MTDNQRLRFQYVVERDSHRRRRREILTAHPEVRALFGFDRKTIAVTIVVVAVQLGIAAAISRAHLGVVPVALLAFLIGAVLSHWCGMAIHETAHNLAAKTALGNRATAWLANTAMVFPIAESFRRYHLEHHGRLGIEGHDSDLPLAIEVQHIGNSRIRKLLWLFFYTPVYFLRGAAYARCLSNAEIANTVAIALTNLALFQTLGWPGFTYLAFSTLIGHSFHPVAAHFLHEHYVYSPGQETYSYYGILNPVTFNVGYHFEHHDFVRIPGSRLPAYRKFTAQHYDGLVSHRSWTWILWHFVMSREMGPHSRIVRRASTKRPHVTFAEIADSSSKSKSLSSSCSTRSSICPAR